MLVPSVLLSLAAPARALDISVDNATSIEAADVAVIEGMVTYMPWLTNTSGATVGVFQAPYYWWEAGVYWSQMIDWQFYTGNTSYEPWIKEALVKQAGTNYNYMTENQTSVEGNDDEAFWGIAAMNAAERNLSRYDDNTPEWLYFAQATFNSMANRWDSSSCGGGLRWQIYTWNAGYDYKNMVANGALFHLAARLSRFTNNDTYVEWAERVWQWALSVGLLSPLDATASEPVDVKMRVLDGAHLTDNCSDITAVEWTYDQGLMLSGCAFLYNYTGNTTWRDRSLELWGRATALFGRNNASWVPGSYVLYEPGCMTQTESVEQCTNDQRCFKGIALSMFGYAMQMDSELIDEMWEYIQYSAECASWSCTGGTDGKTCGLSWLHEGWDGRYGVGEQLCALGAFNAVLAANSSGAYKASDLPEVYQATSNSSNSTDGSSVYGWGSTAGTENDSTTTPGALSVDTSDRGGAGFLTGIVIIFIVAGSTWLVL